MSKKMVTSSLLLLFLPFIFGIFLFIVILISITSNFEESKIHSNQTSDRGLTPAQEVFLPYYKEIGETYKIPWEILASIHFNNPVFQKHSQIAGNVVCAEVKFPSNHAGKKYETLINEAAKANGLDACFLASIIAAESNFQPHVISSAGALGLAQIMPDKCTKDGKRLSQSQCMEPSFNIHRGAQYLALVLNKEWIGGRRDLAAAGYNAGPNATGLKKGQIPPWQETQKYVPRVEKYFQEYIGMSQSNGAKVVVKENAESDITSKDVKKWIESTAKQIQKGANQACHQLTDFKKAVVNFSYSDELACGLIHHTSNETKKSTDTSPSTIWEEIKKIYPLAIQYAGGGLGDGMLIKPVETPISSAFDPNRVHPILGVIRPHNGTDFNAPYGTPVKASASGKVTVATQKGGYGLYVEIDHGANNQGASVVTAYAHLAQIHVQADQTVKQGDIIGTVGSTGLSTGPHLHFEVKINGKYQDPVDYLGKTKE